MNNFSMDYGEYLKSHIPNAKYASGKREINCRCMYCSDSKNQNKGHFYISIPQSDQELSYFDCKKCHASGLVTHTKLIEWGLYDSNIGMSLNKYNSKVLSLPNNKTIKNEYVYNVKYTHITDDKLTRFKLNYINERLGTQLTYDDCIREKIVLNIKDLLSQNNITEYTRHNSIMECLDTSFIGFLSYDNSFLNMRNLEINELPSSLNKRYINYNVFNKMDNTYRFYIIPNNIHLLDPTPIEVHIAEGPFDILSIYHNMYNANNNQKIYAAVGGSGYKGLIRFIINTLKIVNPIIHIYPDKDIDHYKMEDIARLLYPFHLELYIHRNLCINEKDFGVPLNRIRDSVSRLI